MTEWTWIVPTDAQKTLMYTKWTASNITHDGTEGTIGMFGTDDKYYFYH